MTQLPQGTAHPLEVGGTHVVEHQRAVFQMPFGQFLLDLGLAFPQPVHRRVEGLGISLLHFEQLGQDARARFLVEPPSRRELGARVQDPRDDHRDYPIAFFGRFRGDEPGLHGRNASGRYRMSVSSLSLRTIPTHSRDVPGGRERSIAADARMARRRCRARDKMRRPSTISVATGSVGEGAIEHSQALSVTRALKRREGVVLPEITPCSTAPAISQQ